MLERVKPLERILAEGNDDTQPHTLKKSLGAGSLMAMGIGAIIGTGIFVLTGVAAATRSGPSLTISFIVAGIVSALAALCYSEVASRIPIAGSAYTFAYASLGEIDRLDHRLGLGSGVRTGRRHGQHRLVRLLHDVFEERVRSDRSAISGSTIIGIPTPRLHESAGVLHHPAHRRSCSIAAPASRRSSTT